MSHATSDLEYFMCDMCRVYVHRDIFCPHRRECKGPTSKELKKGECAKIASAIDAAERQRLVEEGTIGSGVTPSDTSCPLVLLQPIAVAERLDESRRRREIADAHARRESEKAKAQLKNVDTLLAMLDQ
jgi:hypothetical protein